MSIPSVSFKKILFFSFLLINSLSSSADTSFIKTYHEDDLKLLIGHNYSALLNKILNKNSNFSIEIEKDTKKDKENHMNMKFITYEIIKEGLSFEIDISLKDLLTIQQFDDFIIDGFPKTRSYYVENQKEDTLLYYLGNKSLLFEVVYSSRIYMSEEVNE